MAVAKFIKSYVKWGGRLHQYEVSGYGVTRTTEVCLSPRGKLSKTLNDRGEASRIVTRQEALNTFEAQIDWELARIAQGLPTGKDDMPKKTAE